MGDLRSSVNHCGFRGDVALQNTCVDQSFPGISPLRGLSDRRDAAPCEASRELRIRPPIIQDQRRSSSAGRRFHKSTFLEKDVEGQAGEPGEAHGGDAVGDGAAEAALRQAERGAEPAGGGAAPGEPGAGGEVQPARRGDEGGQGGHRAAPGYEVRLQRQGAAGAEAEPPALRPDAVWGGRKQQMTSLEEENTRTAGIPEDGWHKWEQLLAYRFCWNDRKDGCKCSRFNLNPAAWSSF